MNTHWIDRYFIEGTFFLPHCQQNERFTSNHIVIWYHTIFLPIFCYQLTVKQLIRAIQPPPYRLERPRIVKHDNSMQEIELFKLDHLLLAPIFRGAFRPQQHLREDRHLSRLARQYLKMLVRLRCTRKLPTVEKHNPPQSLTGHSSIEHVSMGNGLFLGLELARDH